MADTKQVRATELGFYRGSMVQPGTVFQVPATFKAKWVVDAQAPAAPVAPKTVREEPTTLSELGRAGRGRLPVGLQPQAMTIGPKSEPHEDRPKGGNTEEPAAVMAKGKAKA